MFDYSKKAKKVDVYLKISGRVYRFSSLTMLVLLGIVDQFYNPKMGVCLMIFNISEAKTNLSKLVNMAYHGKKVVIAKNNLPLVDLVPHKPEGKRTLGLLSGKMEVPDDIMAEDEEINEMFYGSDK